MATISASFNEDI